MSFTHTRLPKVTVSWAHRLYTTDVKQNEYLYNATVSWDYAMFAINLECVSCHKHLFKEKANKKPTRPASLNICLRGDFVGPLLLKAGRYSTHCAKMPRYLCVSRMWCGVVWCGTYWGRGRKMWGRCGIGFLMYVLKLDFRFNRS